MVITIFNGYITNTNDHMLIYSLVAPIKNKCEFG